MQLMSYRLLSLTEVHKLNVILSLKNTILYAWLEKSLYQHLIWRDVLDSYLPLYQVLVHTLLPHSAPGSVCNLEIPKSGASASSNATFFHSQKNSLIATPPSSFSFAFPCLYIKILTERNILHCRLLTFPVFNDINNFNLFNTLLYSKCLVHLILFNLYNNSR